MMGRYGYGDWGMMGGVSPLGDFLMLAFGLVVLAGLVLLVIWAVRASGGMHALGTYRGGMGMVGGGPGPASPTPRLPVSVSPGRLAPHAAGSTRLPPPARPTAASARP